MSKKLSEHFSVDQMLALAAELTYISAFGYQRPEEAVQAITILISDVALPTNYLTFIDILKQIITDPGTVQLERLAEQVNFLLDEALEPLPRRNLVLNLAKLFDWHNRIDLALPLQTEGVNLLKVEAKSQSDQGVFRDLSIALFNLALFQAQIEQFAEAVVMLEQVVALSRRFWPHDLVFDQACLENMKRKRDGLPTLSLSSNKIMSFLETRILEIETVHLSPDEQTKIRQNDLWFRARTPAQYAKINAGRHQTVQLIAKARQAWRCRNMANLKLIGSQLMIKVLRRFTARL